MKVPKEFEGKMVALQLARPVYMFEYGVHAKYQGKEYLVARPIVKEGPGGPDDPHAQAAMTDVLLSALVVQVTDDMVTVAIFDPDPSGDTGNEMHKTIPSALILSIDEVAGFEVAMPIGTAQRRAPSKLIV
jgi:hypothetical protein